MKPPAVLVLAGLDPSGGAGLLADAEAIRALGARPLCVATALTVQTTRAARSFKVVDAALIADSVRALLTPNIAEAEALLEGPADARMLLERGPAAVLLKGGHLPGPPTDVLALPGNIESFAAGRIPVTARGTGCRLASAIAAGLARGKPMREAVIDARRYVREYLQAQIPV